MLFAAEFDLPFEFVLSVALVSEALITATVGIIVWLWRKKPLDEDVKSN